MRRLIRRVTDRVRGIIEFPETRNHYLYCRNNPVIFVDDNGLWPSLKDIGNGIKDAAVGMVTQFKEDPAKALVSLGTGIVVGAAAAAVAAAAVATAPASAAIAVGVLAYAGAGAFTGAVSSIAGQVASKDFKKNGINWKEVGISTLGGAVGGAFFGGISGAASSAAASTAGSMASKIGAALTSKVGRYATAFTGGFIGGSTADVAGQVAMSDKKGFHKFEDVNAGHAIGTGIFGGIQGVATYGLSQTKPGQAFGNLVKTKIFSPVYGLTAKGISPLIEMCKAESGAQAINNGNPKGFKYIHNPSENPKVLVDAIEDPNAVYGYRPKEGGSLSQFAKDDWSNPEVVASARQNRIDYHNRNEGAAMQIVSDMTAEGASREEIARVVCDYRNQSRIEAYIDSDGNITNIDGYEGALKRAEMRSYENLIKSGKTPDDIIRTATKGNPAMDACTGLYDDYYDTYTK